MTVAGMGMLASSLFSFILCRVTKTVEAKAVITPQFWLSRVMPVGFFMGATLWAGNLVYLYLSVSFIQMLKAFTPVITMIALFIAQLETPTTKVQCSTASIDSRTVGSSQMSRYHGRSTSCHGRTATGATGLLSLFAAVFVVAAVVCACSVCC